MLPRKPSDVFRVCQIKSLQLLVGCTHSRTKCWSQIALGQNSTQISSIGPIGRRIPIAYRLDPIIDWSGVENERRIGIRGMNFLEMHNLREGAQGLYARIFVVVVGGGVISRRRIVFHIIGITGITSQHGQRVFCAVHLPKDIVRSTSLERWPPPFNVAFDTHGAEGLRPGIAPCSATGTLRQQTVAPGTGLIVIVIDLTRKVRRADTTAAKVRRDAGGATLGQAHDENGRGQVEFGGQRMAYLGSIVVDCAGRMSAMEPRSKHARGYGIMLSHIGRAMAIDNGGPTHSH